MSSHLRRSNDAGQAGRSPQMLSAPDNIRECLITFYRERDEADARAYAEGTQKARGKTYALGLARLESGADVFESYGVIAAAGVELPQATLNMVEALPQDWSRVCRIDSEGQLWTASLRAKRPVTR